MDLQNELTAMHERMVTDELLNMLLGAYRQEMELMHVTAAEDDYTKAKAAQEELFQTLVELEDRESGYYR